MLQSSRTNHRVTADAHVRATHTWKAGALPSAECHMGTPHGEHAVALGLSGWLHGQRQGLSTPPRLGPGWPAPLMERPKQEQQTLLEMRADLGWHLRSEVGGAQAWLQFGQLGFHVSPGSSSV